MSNQTESRLMRALNILAKWRQPFAAWQLGTRSDRDAECKAVKDHREVTILMRAESNALLGLLVKKGVFTVEEFQTQLTEEAEVLAKEYENKFPGLKATETGISYDIPIARETMKDWRP